VLPDNDVVEHRGMNADQATLTYRAPVQYGGVAHGDVFSDRHRVAPIDVDHRAILHVAAVLDGDEVFVTAMTAPGRTLTPSPSRTRPITVAVGATNAVSDIFGRPSPRLKTAILCCFRGTCLFMIAIPPVCLFRCSVVLIVATAN
jgi:hypothetical protein